MTILEVSRKVDGNHKVIHITIGDKEYLIMGGINKSVTIIAGRQWINNRRSLGKTFWNVDDVKTHYKRHVDVLFGYAQEIMN